MPGCQAITRAGTRCKAIPRAGSEYCPFHDPRLATERREASRKGNAARWKGDPSREILRRVDELYASVLEGTIETAVGAVCNQLLITKLKALEYQRRALETEELAGEVEALKREYGDAS